MASEGAKAGGDSVGGIPKWVLGVAVGVPVAAALIYILFGPSGEPKKKKPRKTGQKEQTKQETKSHGLSNEISDPTGVIKAAEVKSEDSKVIFFYNFFSSSATTLAPN